MIEEDGVLPEGFQAHTDDLGILVFFECVWTNGGQNMPKTGDPRNSMPPSDNPTL